MSLESGVQLRTIPKPTPCVIMLLRCSSVVSETVKGTLTCASAYAKLWTLRHLTPTLFTSNRSHGMKALQQSGGFIRRFSSAWKPTQHTVYRQASRTLAGQSGRPTTLCVPSAMSQSAAVPILSAPRTTLCRSSCSYAVSATRTEDVAVDVMIEGKAAAVDR